MQLVVTNIFIVIQSPSFYLSLVFILFSMVIIVFFICYYFSNSFSLQVLLLYLALGLPRGLSGKVSACQCKRCSLIPGSGRSPGEGIGYPTPVFVGFPGGSDGQESTCNVGDLSLIPGLGRSPGEEQGNLFQYSCLENPHGQRSLAGSMGSQRVGHD